MTFDMKLILKNSRPRCMLFHRFSEGFPHIHNRQLDFAGLFIPQFLKKQGQTCFRSVFTTEPNRPFPQKITNHNPAGMALSDKDFINADHLGAGHTHPPQLLPHVLLFQRLDRLPVQMQFFGNIRYRGVPTPAAHIKPKAFGIKRRLRQPFESFLLHRPAPAAKHPANFQIQEDTRIPAGQVPDFSGLSTVESGMGQSTGSAYCFFPLRTRWMTRAFGSPKIPVTVDSGRNPGNRYVSKSLRDFVMKIHYHFFHFDPMIKPIELNGFLANS